MFFFFLSIPANALALLLEGEYRVRVGKCIRFREIIGVWIWGFVLRGGGVRTVRVGSFFVSGFLRNVMVPLSEG